MSTVVIRERGWPGRARFKAPGSDSRKAPPSLRQGVVLTLVALPEPDITPERLGLGAYYLHAGTALLQAGFILHPEAAPGSRAALEQWARSHPMQTLLGLAPWSVLSAPDFNDSSLRRHIYGAKGSTVVCLNPLHAFALLSRGHAGGRRRAYRGSFSFDLLRPGSQEGSRHWPRLRLQPAGRVGVRCHWAACGPSRPGEDRPIYGQVDRTPSGLKARTGRFVDLLGAAHALDTEPSLDLNVHLREFGLDEVAEVSAVSPDAAGADAVASLLQAARNLALRLDESAQGLDLARLYSPGTVSGLLLAKLGVEPPLAKFQLPDDPGLAAWMRTIHGGRLWASDEVLGQSIPVCHVDIASAYPTAFGLMDGWRLLSAGGVDEVDSTLRVRELMERPLATWLFSPKFWRELGCTRVRVRGTLVLPVTLAEGPGDDREDQERLSEHVEMRQIQVENSLWVAWPDLVASALIGYPGQLLEAVSLLPIGPQRGLKRAKVLGQEFRPQLDLARRLVGLRDQLRVEKPRLARLCRLVANSLVWGQTARFDPAWDSSRKGLVPVEKPGPWCYPPIASTVSAAVRLLVALAEDQIKRLDGEVVYVATDGFMVPYTHDGGLTRLRSGRQVRLLSKPELDRALDPFAALGVTLSRTPSNGDPPTHGVVFGPNRYVLCRSGKGGGSELAGGSEAVLGWFQGPPGAGEERQGKIRGWIADAETALARLASGADGSLNLPWEDAAPGFPALRRLRARSPEVWAEVRDSLGLLPGGRFVQAEAHWANRVPVAKDPGGDLAGWRELPWLDRKSGAPLHPSTDPCEVHVDLVRLATLREKVEAWGRCDGQEVQSRAPLHYESCLVRRVGHWWEGASRLMLDPEDRAAEAGATYRQPKAGEAIARAVQLVGVPAFSRSLGVPERTCRRIASTCGARPRSVDRVLTALRERFPAYEPSLVSLLRWARDHERRPLCALPGCDQPSRRAPSTTCSEAHKKALARQSRVRIPPPAAGSKLS